MPTGGEMTPSLCEMAFQALKKVRFDYATDVVCNLDQYRKRSSKPVSL